MYALYLEKFPSIAQKGQFKGKEKYVSMVLEAFCDYNLWIWYASLGYPGTLNDISIWNQSPLFKMMLDGKLEKVDFNLNVGNENFSKLFLSVDGIYPEELARFVKTIFEPLGLR